MIKRMKWNVVHDDDGQPSSAESSDAEEEEEEEEGEEGGGDGGENEDGSRQRVRKGKAQRERPMRPRAKDDDDSSEMDDGEMMARLLENELRGEGIEFDLDEREDEKGSQTGEETADRTVDVSSEAVIQVLRNEDLSETKVKVCTLCKSVRLLRTEDVEVHLASKRHMKAVKKAINPVDLGVRESSVPNAPSNHGNREQKRPRKQMKATSRSPKAGVQQSAGGAPKESRGDDDVQSRNSKSKELKRPRADNPPTGSRDDRSGTRKSTSKKRMRIDGKCDDRPTNSREKGTVTADDQGKRRPKARDKAERVLMKEKEKSTNNGHPHSRPVHNEDVERGKEKGRTHKRKKAAQEDGRDGIKQKRGTKMELKLVDGVRKRRKKETSRTTS